MDKKVGIVIPIYNAEKFLPECIDSLKKQTYTNFEVVAVDDGSTDGSFALLSKLALHLPWLRVFHTSNHGVSSARNYGMKRVDGDYLCFVDADDWVEPNYIEVLAQYMQQKSMVACGLCTEGRARRDMQVMTPAEAEASVLTQGGIEGAPFCKCYDLKLVREQELQFDTDIAIMEDVLFNIAYLSYCTNAIVWANEPLYHYRKNSDGATLKRFVKGKPLSKKQMTDWEAIKRCEKYLSDDADLRSIYEQKLTKAAVSTLRAMVANDISDKERYKELLSFVRVHSAQYVSGRAGKIGAKLSVILCAISPKLETYIFRRMVL